MLRLILIPTTVICLATLLSCSNSSEQIRFGTYRNYVSAGEADLEILHGGKFFFNDARSESCWSWVEYRGDWNMDIDTLTLTWQTSWKEYPVHISSSKDISSKEISLTFKYEDNKPISNVKVHSLCDDTWNIKYFYTDKKGNVNLSQNRSLSQKEQSCDAINQIVFEIEGGVFGITAYGNDTSDANVFTIKVERTLKQFNRTETRRFLVKSNNLISLDSNNKSWYDNWGNFKFLTKQERKADDRSVDAP